ncbi:MAG: c-type cytochrome biogenesis protein CcmI, partial [Rhodospirillaceae bacterium]|nr:c-type cytochrome biogenesis protein CcmI [Rhodospirillaceae bacterium]
ETETENKGRGGHDIAVYRDQLTELKADLERHLISEKEAEAARIEIERRLLAADRDTDRDADHDRATQNGAAKPPGSVRHRTAIALVLGVVLLSFGLYGWLGSPGIPDLPLAEREKERAASALSPAVDTAQIEGMVAQLAQKLETGPGDPKAWRMLARSYLVLDRAEEAQAAYLRGREHFPDDAGLLADHATFISVMATPEGSPDMVVPLPAAAMFERVLTIEPENGEALWFSGLAAVQGGENARASALWSRLYALIPVESKGRVALKDRIDALGTPEQNNNPAP